MDAFKVGLFSLSAIAAVVFMSFRITLNQSGFGDYVDYKTIVRDASGIFPKTPIKVAGINAGRIKSIDLVGNNAVITFEVLERVRVTEGSKLRIRSIGFLGDRYLDIVIGDSDRRLSPGSSLIAIEGEGVEQLMIGASDILKDMKIMMTSIREAMVPEGEESPLSSIVKNIDAITSDAKYVMESFREIVGSNDQRISEMIDNFNNLSAQLRRESDSSDPESAISELRQILASTRKMSNDMEKMVADIRAGRGTFGKLFVEEEIADEVRTTLAGVQRMVTRAESIRTELEMYSGVNTDYGAETAGAFRIYPSPERFYHLGITTSEFGPEKETITRTVVDDGPEERVVRRELKSDEWRFDLQIGRRIQNWTIRGGLIESTGGFGVDYHLHTWNQKFSVEAYDYRDDDGLNLRLRTDLQLWNVIYGRFAVEDSLNSTRSATISAGLKFTDEDLKGLVAFFL